jgi:GT2 family glycosyltransferase
MTTLLRPAGPAIGPTMGPLPARSPFRLARAFAALRRRLAPAPADGAQLALRSAPDGSLVAALPHGTPRGWCRLRLRLPPGLPHAFVQLVVETDRLGCAAAIPLASAHRRGARTRRAVAFVPDAATGFRLELFADLAAQAAAVEVFCAPLSRCAAALALAARMLPRLGATVLRGMWRAPNALPARLRADLAVGATAGTPPDASAAYALWRRLFERPTCGDPGRGAAGNGLRLLRTGLPEARPTQPDEAAPLPSIAVVVLHAAPAGAALGASLAAAAAALAALGQQPGVPRDPLAVGPGSLPLARALAATTDYLAVLQAGEVVPRHALAVLARHAAALGRPAILYADEDSLALDGTRHDPLFKPAPSRMLMLSGSLATGLWLIRRDLLAADIAAGWAEALRLDAWLRLHEAGGAKDSHRVPLILTHRRADAETAPAAVLAAVARAHCARTGLPARISAARPLGLRLAAPPEARSAVRLPVVSLIVPSACRAPHVAACLGAILAQTDYPAMEVVLVLTAGEPPDRTQRRLLARLTADPRVRPVLATAPRFNFAAACNRGAAAARGSLLCLLNDDVAPRDPGWLAAMVGHLADPDVGVVGARLLYPDATVQHAGVVLCPDGTGAHWHRLLPAAAPGYGGRAVLSQEFSAVTGACLLTRRSLWDRLGGLDEAFASAFNDVDFCLRARAAGAAVVLAAEAELTHAESRSFGRHYRSGAAEAARNRADRARLLDRFGAAFRADPFHSPNLSPWSADPAALRFPPASAALDPNPAPRSLPALVAGLAAP